MRTEGRRDDAAHVAKLRRPTIAAWAVNQVVRRHRDRVAALLEAGLQVRRAQRRALSGVRRSGLREATRTRRELIDELTNLAAEILADQGSGSESHRSDIAATFDAASADDDAAEMVGAARLAAPLPVSSEFGGFDGLAVLPEPEPPDEPDVRTADDDVDEAERERAAQRRRDAIRAVDEARRQMADAEAEAREAADAAAARVAAAEEADRAAQEAKEAWRRMQREAAELHEQVARARDRADATRREAERHMTQLQERERELNDLDR